MLTAAGSSHPKAAQTHHKLDSQDGDSDFEDKWEEYWGKNWTATETLMKCVY